MAAFNFEHDQVVRLAQAHGWRVEHKGSGIRLFRDDRTDVQVTTGTPRGSADPMSGRALYNQIRRTERAHGIVDGVEAERARRYGTQHATEPADSPPQKFSNGHHLNGNGEQPPMPREMARVAQAAGSAPTPYADLPEHLKVRVEVAEVEAEVARRERFKWEEKKIMPMRSVVMRLRRFNALEKVAAKAMALIDAHVELLAERDITALELLTELRALDRVRAPEHVEAMPA